MKRILTLIAIGLALTTPVYTQSQTTGVGVGIYPTGTETGLGIRSSRDKRLAVDVRMTRANFFTKPASGSFVNEASLVYRIAYYEKVRFHLGIGGRADWNVTDGRSNRFGFVTPVGVEAFPFPFQHAGLFFEAAPFCAWQRNGNANAGIRTVAGFVFYFLKQDKHE